MKTDWEAYYSKGRKREPTIFQWTTIFKITKLVNRFFQNQPIVVGELGGGDSCIYSYFVENIRVRKYFAVDNNALSLSQILDREGSPRPDVLLVDLLLEAPHLEADLIFSIGLIEHFTLEDTAKVLRQHIKMVRRGGVVLVTFPTPTLVYRSIRSCAELLGVWRFPDERPLSFEEVESIFLNSGCDVIHRSINWWVLLTQGYIVAKVLEKNISGSGDNSSGGVS